MSAMSENDNYTQQKLFVESIWRLLINLEFLKDQHEFKPTKPRCESDEKIEPRCESEAAYSFYQHCFAQLSILRGKNHDLYCQALLSFPGARRLLPEELALHGAEERLETPSWIQNMIDEGGVGARNSGVERNAAARRDYEREYFESAGR